MNDGILREGEREFTALPAIVTPHGTDVAQGSAKYGTDATDATENCGIRTDGAGQDTRGDTSAGDAILIVRNRAGALACSVMLDWFEGIMRASKPMQIFDLSRKGEGFEIEYVDTRVQFLWVGFSIGLRFSERNGLAIRDAARRGAA